MDTFGKESMSIMWHRICEKWYPCAGVWLGDFSRGFVCDAVFYGCRTVGMAGCDRIIVSYDYGHVLYRIRSSHTLPEQAIVLGNTS